MFKKILKALKKLALQAAQALAEKKILKGMDK